MRFLLDTNVVSETQKVHSGKANAGVVSWLASVHAADLYISAITLLEIELGILRVERKDLRKAAALRKWFEDQVVPEFADRTLAVDAAVALRCAHLHVTKSKPERDALIAATALVHGMSVVTRNAADFDSCGVTVLNPWSAQH